MDFISFALENQKVYGYFTDPDQTPSTTHYYISAGGITETYLQRRALAVEFLTMLSSNSIYKQSTG
jgi:hypothetical protein